MAISVAAAILKPAVTTLAFESAQRYLHGYAERKGKGDDGRHQELRQGLSSLLHLAEQDVLRDLNSGLAALEDCIETQNEGTRQSRLQFAEQQLLRCTHLDPALSTGGQPNTYLMAIAHHKLALASTLRGDRVIAAKHLLKCFQVDPHAARLELAPDLYKQLFEPQCADILELRDAEYNKIAQKYASKWLGFQAQCLKQASKGVSAWGKGMDWVLTKAHRDPKQKGRKNSQAAPEDFLASSSEDESPAGTSYAAHTDQTGRLNHPEASVSPQVTAAQGPPRTQVEYARTYTSRWANQMDSQAQEVEQQATASKRVVKRVDEKRRAVDKMLDQKLDERCRKIADDLLRGGSPGVVNASINFHGNQPMQATVADSNGGRAQVTFLPDSVQVQHLPAPPQHLSGS